MFRSSFGRLSLCLLACLVWVFPAFSGESQAGLQLNKKGPYLGQDPPGETPKVFAPGIVSTGLTTRDLAMTPDGKEIYFSVVLGQYAHSAIAFTRETKDGWTNVEIADFSGFPDVNDLEPCITPDGKRFLFLSNRANPAKNQPAGNQDIWVMDRLDGGWSAPYNLGAPVNSEDNEFFPSVTRDGTIYFTRAKKDTHVDYIFRSRFVNGQYLEPEKLPAEVNAGRTQFNAFIDPDEKFLILSIIGLPDAFGRSDYYICFRNDDDTWEKPINLGTSINQPGTQGYAPYISPDGAFFFFMSTAFTEPTKPLAEKFHFRDYLALHTTPQNGNANICWVQAEFLEKLKKAE